jgi:hypothetical protein
MPDTDKTLVISSAEQLFSGATRRNFLRAVALGGTAIFLPSVFSACDSGNNNPFMPGPNGVALDLSNDTGILNYAYAAEQLEAAFYTQAVANFGASNLSAAEKIVLQDIKNHEVIHREAFKTLLGGNRIPDLAVNFTSISFTQRTAGGAGVLEVAKAFEDLGVSAYNGAGKYLRNATYLTLAGKIVSVEARHAAAIRDLLNPGSADFSGDDVVDANGLDGAREPSAVLGIAATYISTAVSISKSPVLPA